MAGPTSGSPNHGDSAPPAGGTPRLRRFSFDRVAVGIVLLLLALFTLRQVASPDVGFHLEVGNDILSGNGWPQTDRYTYTVTDRPYVDTSWGFQVVLAAVERATGATGMILLHVGMVFATFLLVTLTAKLVPGEVRVLVSLLLIGGLAAEPRFEVRPEVLSFMLLALVLHLLHRHAEGARAQLWLLPPIFLAWTNSHSLFVLGWVVMVCFLAGLWMRQRRVDLPLLGWCAASIAVGLVNPYGWRALAFPLELLTRMQGTNVFARHIGEFDSPIHYLTSDQLMFYLVPIVCFFLFALLALVSVPVLRRQRRFHCVLLALAFLPLALVMVRNVPLLVVTCLPGAVWGLSFDRVCDALRLRGAVRRGLRRVFLATVLLIVVGIGMRVCTDAYYVSSRRLERFGFGWNALALPIDAAAYAGRTALPGRMLNHLNFGGWLLWALPEPVFIDGRLEVMGEAFYQEYRRALDSPEGLDAAVRRHDVGWVVFPYRLEPGLLYGLSRHPAWRLVYADHSAAIFARRSAATETLVHPGVRDLERAAQDSLDVGSLPGLGGVERSTGVAHWLAGFFRRQVYPTEAFNRGIFHYQRKSAAPAAAGFAEALRLSDGAYYEIYNNLGASLAAMGRFDAARTCYRIYLSELPLYRREPRRRTLAQLAAIQGRP